MKSVFDAATESELINRICKLTSGSHARWGKMSVGQMLTHCRMWDDMILGNLKVNRMFAGRIFGRNALKAVLKDETPLGQNSPSAKELIIVKTVENIEELKQQSIASIHSLAQLNTPTFFHPFFGTMTREQVGQLAYKHHDHHLRQFGV
jgi:Protein of unknown function (DUF1569)